MPPEIVPCNPEAPHRCLGVCLPVLRQAKTPANGGQLLHVASKLFHAFRQTRILLLQSLALRCRFVILPVWLLSAASAMPGGSAVGCVMRV